MGTEEEKQTQKEDTTEAISFKQFLEEYPTGTLQTVSEYWQTIPSQYGGTLLMINAPPHSVCIVRSVMEPGILKVSGSIVFL